jgi:flagellar basal-body rod protein FlgB
MDRLFGTPTDAVTRGALDGLAARHRVFANNIANVDTPGFQPSDVPFEAQLRQVRDEMELSPTLARRLSPTTPEPVVIDQGAERIDGNGVQIDQQVAAMADNTLTYEALAQAAKLRNNLLRTAITEGRG